ncbi:TRAP transporter small permease subunit [Paracoccus aestuariivivens]|uniref:TRAP transporter small permease protein n=2 Tax=Paracoccus aestuariivivens TaxID=1820333 RepID=A0A6L6JEX6_9RHOB|nr:TRAP transporter small permease subunit [Paracoccus aestuariivivens]
MPHPPLALRILNQLAMVCALVAGAAVAILAVLIVVDVLGRSLFGYSLQGTDELGGYVLALCGSLGLSWALVKRAHPRIDLGFRFFGIRLRAALHVLAHASLAGFALFMAWHAYGELAATLRFGAVTNTPLQTPLWVPQGLWLVGLVQFAITALAMALHGAWLMSLDLDAVSRIYGPPTVQDEVGEYVAQEG